MNPTWTDNEKVTPYPPETGSHPQPPSGNTIGDFPEPAHHPPGFITNPTNYSNPGQPPPYNNYPPPPTQPYPGSTGNTNDTVAAAQAVNAAISQNGRTPVTIVCPTCKNLVVTELTEIQSQSVEQQSRSKIIYIFFGGGLVMFGTFVLAATLISGSLIPLAFLPVFLIFFAMGFLLFRRSAKEAVRLCTDIQHRCSSCKILLGVSSGAQYFQQMQMNNRYNRHRHY